MLGAEQGAISSSSPSVHQPLCEAVVQLVLDHVRADGYGAHIQDLVRRHFATLPARYTLSVDPRRHDDVLLHMRLLKEVRGQMTHPHSQPHSRPGEAHRGCTTGPVVSVRHVGLVADDQWCTGGGTSQPEPDHHTRGGPDRGYHTESDGEREGGVGSNSDSDRDGVSRDGGRGMSAATDTSAGRDAPTPVAAGGALGSVCRDNAGACCALPDLRAPRGAAPEHAPGVPRGAKGGGRGGGECANPYAQFQFQASADELGKRAWAGGGGGGAGRGGDGAPPVYRIPRPTFGSCASLSSLHITRPPSKAPRSSQKRSPRGIPVAGMPGYTGHRTPRSIPVPAARGRGAGAGMGTGWAASGSRATPGGTPGGTPTGGGEGGLVLGSEDGYAAGLARHCRSAPIPGQSVLGGRRGSMSSLDEDEYGEDGDWDGQGDGEGEGDAGDGKVDGERERGDGEGEEERESSCGKRGEREDCYAEGGEREGSCGDGWSECEGGVALGWEVTIAAPDRPGLLKSFTAAIGRSEHDLDIKEAHVFSSLDGYALQVFVVTSPNPHEETLEIQESLQRLLKATWQDKGAVHSKEMLQMNNLKASVESMCYEDWAVEARDLSTHEKLGGGSSGRLYRGTYRGQEVAVKVICMAAPGAHQGCTGGAYPSYPDPIELGTAWAHQGASLATAWTDQGDSLATGWADCGEAGGVYPDTIELGPAAVGPMGAASPPAALQCSSAVQYCKQRHVDPGLQYCVQTCLPTLLQPGAEGPGRAGTGAEGSGEEGQWGAEKGPPSEEPHPIVAAWNAFGGETGEAGSGPGAPPVYLPSAPGAPGAPVSQPPVTGILGGRNSEPKEHSEPRPGPEPEPESESGLWLLEAKRNDHANASKGVAHVSDVGYTHGEPNAACSRDRLSASLSQADGDRLAASLSPPPAPLAPAAELLQCFQREVSIMRAVRHKNVLQFIGACSCWPRLYIVTELMSRGSIRNVLDQLGTGLPLHAALRVFRDAARGMDFLHRRGIVHRDVKAANLLMDENDVVKVCDFGVARFVPPGERGGEAGPGKRGGTGTPEAAFGQAELAPSPDQSMDMTSETGTYRWMAPEVLEHKPYGFKADVFSFGITMWEVLYGEIPYRGMTPLQAAVGVVQRGLRPPLGPDFPPLLADLLTRCWSAEPAERPTFSEVLASLSQVEEILQGEGSQGGSSRGKPSAIDRQHPGGLHQLWRKTFGKR